MTMVILCYCLYGLLQLTAVSAQVNIAGNCDILVSLELHLSMHVAYAEFHCRTQSYVGQKPSGFKRLAETPVGMEL